MDFKTYSKKFEDGAIKAGYSAPQILKCLNYAETLCNKDLPVIYNSDHLAVLVGYSKAYLKRAVLYPRSFYRTFYIIKKSGGKRELSEPLPSLKEIQKWILKELLYKIKIHPYAKAYVPGGTIRDNIKYHKKRNEILTLDISNFFGSISLERIQGIFQDAGYAPIISSLLCKLVTLNGSLAQGAPTSPYLSNIVLKNFDSRIEQYSKENKLMFTRYADDLTFSGTTINQKEITELVTTELNKIGLSLNVEKTKLMKKSGRQVVTGIVVNVKAQVLRNERKLIRQQIYYIKKYGLKEHMKRVEIAKDNYIKHLLGKVNYAIFINPHDAEMISYKGFLISLL